jgi:type I restriction enzyme S subunit
MAAVEELSGRIDLTDRRPFKEVKKGFTRFRSGDLLFAKITPSMENGKIAVVRDLADGVGCGSTEFHVIRPATGVEADYLRYYIVRSAFRQEAKRNMQGAVGQQRVPPDFIRDAHLPLAPSNEQRRIVSKIEQLFSRIGDGEHALEQVQKLVERYRQSVLKAAVTGELTREWRQKQKVELESGDALLQRILKARREAWEKAELDKMKAKGQKPANDKWKHNYQEPSPTDTTDLPELPEGWVWTSLGQIKLFSLYGPRFSSEAYADDGYLVLRTSDINKAGRVNVASAPKLKLTKEEFQKIQSRARRSAGHKDGKPWNACTV